MVVDLSKLLDFVNKFIDKAKLCLLLYPEVVITTIIYMAITTLRNAWGIQTVAIILLTLIIVVLTNTYFNKFELYVKNIMLENILRCGKGLSSKSIKLLTTLLRTFIMIALLTFGYTISKNTYSSFNLSLMLLLISFLGMILTVLFPHLYVVFSSSQRKTEAEVELPYALIFLRTLAPLRLPIYELLGMIEESASLKAFSRELKFSKKVSSITSTSILTALDNVLANHPSTKIRDIFRRVVTAAVAVGDIKDVTEKVFDEVYTWFESKASTLVEKFTIIVGSALFVYFFIPVVITTLIPLIGGNTFSILIIILSIQVATFFILYAIISNLYPSSLSIRIPKKLSIVGGVSLVLLIFIAFVNLFLQIVGKGFEDTLFVALMVFLGGVPAILAEIELNRVKLYNSFVRLASDILGLVVATGENPVKALSEAARKCGEKMRRLITSITNVYTSKIASQSIVMNAPSIYHAAFIETLLTIFRLGFVGEALKVFTSSYEKINVIMDRVRSFANTLEIIMVSLSAIIGGFIAYLGKVYLNLMSLVMRTSTISTLVSMFIYNSTVFQVVEALSVLSILFISFFIGKIRGGSILYSFRTLTLMILVYTLAKTFVLKIT